MRARPASSCLSRQPLPWTDGGCPSSPRPTHLCLLLHASEYGPILEISRPKPQQFSLHRFTCHFGSSGCCFRSALFSAAMQGPASVDREAERHTQVVTTSSPPMPFQKLKQFIHDHRSKLRSAFTLAAHRFWGGLQATLSAKEMPRGSQYFASKCTKRQTSNVRKYALL